MSTQGSDRAGYGWLVFAAIMLVLGGTFGVIDGIVALTRSEFFRPHAEFVFSNLDTWAWIVIVTGGLQIVAGAALGTGSELARWYGIAAAGLNGVVQLLAIQAYPAWSIAMFAVDILVIYALTVYAGERLRR
jgi:hypothetical protein